MAYDRETWDEIREKIQAGMKPGQLAKIYKPISRQAIDKKAREHGWFNHRTEIDQRAIDKADGLRAGQSVEEASYAIESASNERAILILKHRQQWAEIDEFRTASILAARDAMKARTHTEKMKGFAEANALIGFYTRHANALSFGQEGQRRAYGFDYKLQRNDDADEAAETETRWALLDALDESERTESPMIEGEATEIRG
jgi:hypothetical protein